MIDKDTQAANRFYKVIRQFALRAKSNNATINYWTKPDEIYDITLVSQRIYGNREEVIVIMAAAGLDTIDQALTQRQLILPTAPQLYAIKRATGFESKADYRENFKPIWAD